MAGLTKIDTHGEGRKGSGRFQVTRHIFVENLEEPCHSSKQINDRRQIRRDLRLRVDRREARDSSSSDSDISYDDGRDLQMTSSQTGRRVSWAEELVTVHEYIKDKRKFSFVFACIPRRLSL